MRCEVCYRNLSLQEIEKPFKGKDIFRCKRCIIKYFDEFTPQELEERKNKGVQ